MANDLLDSLRRADDQLLAEIQRESEARLQAQITIALASDMRAMTFLGFLCAISVVAVGAGFSAMVAESPIGHVAIFIGMGFAVAAYFAFEASSPKDFNILGNNPAAWKADIDKRTSYKDAIAEQIAHYDEMIDENTRTMEENARFLRTSARVALTTMAIGAMFSVLILSGIFTDRGAHTGELRLLWSVQ